MDLKTISDIFDTKLSAFSGGISKDEYEKSIYLTEAQDTYYNALLDVFEDSSTISYKLARLVQSVEISTFNGPTFFGGYTVAFASEIKQVLRDKVLLTSTNPIYNNKEFQVVEDRLSEIIDSLQNPFRKPHYRHGCVRVLKETSNISTVPLRNVELYVPVGTTLSKYTATIALKANPIILETLPDGLSIHGESSATTSFSFPDAEIMDIINIAVKAVVEDTKIFAAQKP
jgi:hypothetical protein